MTIANWILLGAVIITFGLLIVSHILQKKILFKVCSCIIIPIFGALNTLLLRKYLPDSLHLLKISITALSLITISTLFIAFEDKKFLRVSGRFFVIAGIVCWITLYRSIFFIHKVPLWLIILVTAFYIASNISTLIAAGKQEPLACVLFIASFAISSYLHFCTLIFLCYERTLSSIMLFAGASLFLLLNAFHYINQDKKKNEHAGVIRFSLLLASQFLIACSNILMIR